MSLALRVALRQLWRYRAANILVIATLAAVTGALLAVLAIADNLLVNPWTYDTQRLGVLQHRSAASDQLNYTFSAQEYRAIESSGVFEQVNAAASAGAVLLGGDGFARQVRLVRTLPQATAITDASPVLGRFVEEPDVGAANPGIVISHELWQSLFVGRDDAIGKSVNVDGIHVEVIGVMPERFHYLGGDLWTGLATRVATETSTDRQYVINFKLKTAGSLDSALTQIGSLAQGISESGPVERYPPGWTIVGDLIIDAVMGPMRPALFLVIGATILMLLIGLVNVFTLLVSRHMASEGESALRMALGSPFSSLVALSFAQNVVLTLLGVTAGWVAGAFIFRILIGLISAEWIPRELEGHFRYADASVWWIPLLAGAIAAALTVAQLARLRQLNPGVVVREGTRTGERGVHKLVRRGLIGGQIAAASFVSILALSIVGGATGLSQQHPGFDPQRVLVTRVVLSEGRYTDAAERTGYFQRLVDTISRVSNVESVAVVDFAPFQRSVRSGTVSGDSIEAGQSLPVDFHSVHGDLAGTLRPRLVEGRLPGPQDRSETLPVTVVTEALAAKLGRAGSVVGSTIVVQGQIGGEVRRTIIGVVGDVRHDSPLALPRPAVYVPYSQDTGTGDGLPPRSMDVLVKLKPGAAVPDGFLQSAIADVDPMVPTLGVGSLEDRGQASMAGVTLARHLFTMFAAIAVVLAVLGCHVMLQLALELRRRELAIRSALGASPSRLFRMVVLEGASIAFAGSAVGVALGCACIRIVNTALQDVARLDVTDIAGVPTGLVLIASLASLWTARAAATLQPQELLRAR